MSEHSKPPMSEASRGIESRDSSPRDRAIGAFNRSMDRMKTEADAIKTKVDREGTSFLTDYDKKVVLGYRAAEEGVKRLTGGSDRLSGDVEGDKFKVKVHDRTTGEEYDRDEGIPIGGVKMFLNAEYKRLTDLASQARKESRYDDATGLRMQAGEIHKDITALIPNSRGTFYSLLGDVNNAEIPEGIRKASTSDSDHDVVEYFQRNRIGEEAYLRNIDPLIAQLGGESERENWENAAQDLLKDRDELKIPAKDAKFTELKIADTPKLPEKVTPIRSDVVIEPPVTPEIVPTRVTALAIPDSDIDKEGVVRVLVPGLSKGGERVRGGVVADSGSKDVREDVIDLSDADRGGRGARRELVGILEEPKAEKEGESESGGPVIIDGEVVRGAEDKEDAEVGARGERLAKIKGIGKRIWDRARSYVGRIPSGSWPKIPRAAGLVGAAMIAVALIDNCSGQAGKSSPADLPTGMYPPNAPTQIMMDRPQTTSDRPMIEVGTGQDFATSIRPAAPDVPAALEGRGISVVERDFSFGAEKQSLIGLGKDQLARLVNPKYEEQANRTQAEFEAKRDRGETVSAEEIAKASSENGAWANRALEQFRSDLIKNFGEQEGQMKYDKIIKDLANQDRYALEQMNGDQGSKVGVAEDGDGIVFAGNDRKLNLPDSNASRSVVVRGIDGFLDPGNINLEKYINNVKPGE